MIFRNKRREKKLKLMQEASANILKQCIDSAQALRALLLPHNQYMPLFTSEYPEIADDEAMKKRIDLFMAGGSKDEQVLKMANVIIEKQKHE